MAVICVFILILGFGVYYARLTQTDKEGNGGAVDPAPVVSEQETRGFPEDLESGIVLEETRITVPEPEGTLGWTFGARAIEYDTDKNKAILREVEGVRFVEDKPQLEIHAGALKIDFTTGMMDFEGNVRVRSDKGPGFSAAVASWDPGTKRFKASGSVLYEDGLSKISGDELEVDVELEITHIKGNVRFRSPLF